MAAIIQFRRDTASNWTSENPTLADGEFALESDTTKYKIGDGSTVWTSLSYGGLGSIDTALIDAKGDLIGGTADNTVGKLSVGTNGQVLVADSSQTTGLKWVTNESIVNWHEAVKYGTVSAIAAASSTYANGTAGVGATLTHTPTTTPDDYARLQIDGGNVTTGDRVLVQDQATPAHNGVYDVTAQGVAGTSAWVLTRAVDFDGNPAGQIKQGESVYVLSGTTNGGQGFVVTSTSDPHTVGTHSITFTQFTGTQAFTAGTALTISGNTINHDASGASAASYGSATQVTSLTVDAQGHLTAVSNTTIAIPSTAVTDFTEAVQDVAGAQVATNGSHTGIGATYDDAGDGAIDLTLTASGVSAASYGSATQVPGYTVDTYGRLTAASNTTIAIPSTAVTDFTEAVQDVSGAQLATNGSHTGITAAYDDAGDGAIDLALVTENVQDITGAQIATNGSHTGLTATYDDAGDGAVDLKVTEIHDTDGDSKVHWSGDDELSFYINGGNRHTLTQTAWSTGGATWAASDCSSWAIGKNDSGATATPIIYINRDSGSQAANDLLGQIQFNGDDDGGSDNLYGYITGAVQDPAAGAEDGIIRLSVSVAGTGTDIVDVMESGVNLATGKGVLVAGTTILTSTSLAATVVLADGVAATTQSANDSTTKVATTAFVMTELADYAPLASPTLTGVPAAPTAAADTNTTQIATTAYVQTELAALSSDSITDADGDTKIQVEEGSDEDIIRFDTAGTERMSIGATGTVTIVGDLTVNGTTTTVNSTTLTVDDKNIEIGSVATPSDTTADGGGITLKGATDKTWNWVNSTDAWTSSEHIALATSKSLYIDSVLQLSKNALAATVVLADGVAATTQAANDSTTKVATTAFVMTEIGDYAPLASPTLTGVPAAPTAAADTNTTQIATTAYVQTELGALSSDSISDADNDTKIQVEEGSDDDTIRFDIAGTEVATMGAYGLYINARVVSVDAFQTQTGTSYTPVIGDRGYIITMNNGSASTLTVPPNSSVAFAVGNSMRVVQLGAGQVTIVAGSGVTLRYTPGLKLRAQYSSVTLTKIATDEWIVIGDLDD